MLSISKNRSEYQDTEESVDSKLHTQRYHF